MLNRWSSKTVLGLLLATVLSQPLFGQAPPSGDTFVSNVTPKLNYGSGISLLVGPGTTSYVQFNLSSIPAGATISKASLRIYVDAISGTGTLDVFPVTASWNENKATYNTRPSQGNTSAIVGGAIPITSANWNQFLLIDVTPLVQSWLNGTTTNNGIALSLTSGSGTFSLDSKESLLTGNGPELEIALASGTGPQGPPGPIGLTGPTGPQGLQGVTGPAGITGTQGVAGPQGQTGSIGATGPQGPMGVNGAPGPQGVQGPQGATGTSFSFRGPFDCSATYAPGDVISYQGSSWITNTPIGGCVQPPFDPWQLLAQQGATGSQGAAGATGQAGPMGATGLQGFPGPAGAAGPSGPVGPVGPAGPSSSSTMFLTGTIPGALADQKPIYIVPDEDILITGMNVFVTPGIGCSVPATISIVLGLVRPPFAYSLNLNDEFVFYSSSPLSIPVSAGTTVFVGVTTAPQCGVFGFSPQDASISVRYKAQ
jgi:hypothetical protein